MSRHTIEKPNIYILEFLKEGEGVRWELKLASNGYLLASTDIPSYCKDGLGVIGCGDDLKISNYPFLNPDCFDIFSMSDILNDCPKRRLFEDILKGSHCAFVDSVSGL